MNKNYIVIEGKGLLVTPKEIENKFEAPLGLTIDMLEEAVAEITRVRSSERQFMMHTNQAGMAQFQRAVQEEAGRISREGYIAARPLTPDDAFTVTIPEEMEPNLQLWGRIREQLHNTPFQILDPPIELTENEMIQQLDNLSRENG